MDLIPQPTRHTAAGARRLRKLVAIAKLMKRAERAQAGGAGEARGASQQAPAAVTAVADLDALFQEAAAHKKRRAEVQAEQERALAVSGATGCSPGWLPFPFSWH